MVHASRDAREDVRLNGCLHSELAPAAARTIHAIPTYWGPKTNGSSATMAAAFFALGFGASGLVPWWLASLSLAFFLEQSIETITVIGGPAFWHRAAR